jgi:hypothetical protein
MKKKAPSKSTPPSKAFFFFGMKPKMPKQAAADIPLVPFDDFKKAVKKILSNTKVESDRQMAEFQASNLKKREAKKRG